MAKGMIYAANTTQQTVEQNGLVAFGNVVRKCGNAVTLVGGNVMTTEAGFYSVDVNLTLSLQAAGAVTASVLVNGLPVAGATATMTTAAAGDSVSLSIPCVIRTYGCCMASPSTITVELSAAANVTNAAIEVIK